VPLSEHEQRLFEQIERSLAEDPKFASAVRASDPRFHARRRLLVAAVLVVAGLGLVVYGAVRPSVLVGVAGFVVMLGAAGFALTSLRRAQGSELRSVGGTARRSTRRRSSLVDRLEERWRQRPENGRK
jgi:fatty acid desaturase